MFKSILVPVDGSPFSEHAVPMALSIARRAEAAVHFVYVHSPLASVYPEAFPLNEESFDFEIKTRQRAYLENLVRRAAATGQTQASFAVLEGDIAPVLHKEADRVKADLVVMTTHGRGPVARFWLGSVADKLVRDVRVPLLLIRPSDAAPDWDQELEFKHILVPLDGSSLGQDILEPTLALGGLGEADYTLLRVIPPVGQPGVGMEGSFGPGVQALAQGRKELQEKLHKDAENYLNGVVERLSPRKVKVVTRVIAEQQPATAILNEARAGMNLIALATHGRRGLARMILGSVADKVIRGSTLPVLVHRPTEA
jgi:nucleotide-binding universal stress UspA family protein